MENARRARCPLLRKGAPVEPDHPQGVPTCCVADAPRPSKDPRPCRQPADQPDNLAHHRHHRVRRGSKNHLRRLGCGSYPSKGLSDAGSSCLHAEMDDFGRIANCQRKQPINTQQLTDSATRRYAKKLLHNRKRTANISPCVERRTNGLWRSLVAHLTGGQGAAGSNPVNPTSFFESRLTW